MPDLRPWKRGTAAQRAANNAVPTGGELGVEVDTGNLVAADGVSAWSALKRLVRFDEVTTAVQQYVTSVVVTNTNLTALAAESGYVWALVGSSGRLALGVTPDGTVAMTKVALPAASVARSNLTSDVAASVPVTAPNEAAVVYGITDSAGLLAFGIKADGTFTGRSNDTWMRGTAVNGNYVVTMVLDTAGHYQIHSHRRTDGVRSILTSSGRNTMPSITSDDKIIFRHEDDSAGAVMQWVPAGGGTPAAVLPDKDTIACWGDSLTAGTGASSPGTTDYPSRLIALIRATGTPVQRVNEGTGGQRSYEIAARQGGNPMTVTLNGGQIPATVTATAITAQSVSPMFNQTAGSTLKGSLAGVPGTLTLTTSGGVNSSADVYSFTRTTAGSAVTVAPGTPFIPADAVAYAGKAVVLWAGRNNYSIQSQVLADIASMVAYLTPLVKRVIVLSILNGSSEGSGTAAYTQITGINAQLATTYGNDYIDVRSYLISNGLADAGLTPTTQDTADIAADIVPTQLRYDNIHLLDPGYQIVAQRVFNRMTSNGWLS